MSLLGAFFSFSALAQGDYYLGSKGFWKAGTPDLFCTNCSFTHIGNWHIPYLSGISLDPDSNLYVLTNPPVRNLYIVDTVTGDPSVFFAGPFPASLPNMGGLVSMGNGIFYTISRFQALTDTLYLWDTNAGTITAAGSLSIPLWGEMWLANGIMYYLGFIYGEDQIHIVQIDLSNTSNSQSIITIPLSHGAYGFTATPVANMFMGVAASPLRMFTLNIIDGTLKDVCDVYAGPVRMLTSFFEHQNTESVIHLDLDCDDSSLATGPDFNAVPFDCFNEGGIQITDEDIVIQMDAYINEIIFEIANPLDGPNEIFTLTGSTPGIIVDGSGTPFLTLYSEGAATIKDFETALKLVRYDNLSLSPTAGTRTIEVHFTTQSGETSNIARAYIEVIQQPQLQFDIGPDVELCEGTTVLLNANIYSSQYEWSTGETTQIIEVNEAGLYSVIVYSNTMCPNIDEVEVEILPVIHISLNGDTSVCAGFEANLIITSDAPFPIDVQISSTSGSSFSFENIIGEFSFTDEGISNNVYEIIDVIPSMPACIEIIDPEQSIEIFPTFLHNEAVMLCEGDSILLGGIWRKEEGIYPINLQTIHACDSVINYTVVLITVEQIFLQEFTCDSSALGLFTTLLINPEGCDTVVTKTVSMALPDTTKLNLTTCNLSEAGVLVENLSNQTGCDSVVITAIAYLPQADTTLLSLTSCDSSQFGISFLSLLNVEGCDSIIMVEVTGDVADTTYLQLTSCDASSLGVFDYHYTTANGCDSTVIATVTYAERDSIFLEGVSCDPANTGVFVSTFTNIFGCDSVVTEIISLSASNEMFIIGTTCDPALAGLFIDTLVNQFGCDSVVHETISLLPVSETFLSSTTCIGAEAGTFINIYPNQFGCDSIVTSTINFIPGSQTEILIKTCDPTAVGIIENIFAGSGGCDSVEIVTVELFPLPVLELIVASGYNGFDISCFGENDGSIAPELEGVEPFQFTWSDGSVDSVLVGLPAGNYILTVTDANGCKVIDTISLIQPDQLSVAAEVINADCLNEEGATVVVIAEGGSHSYYYSIDGDHFQYEPIFEELASGNYTIMVSDGNECRAETEISIQAHASVEVSLGDDITISAGETVSIEAVINVPQDSLSGIEWLGELPVCSQCHTNEVSPLHTSSYIVVVTDLNGCVASDTIVIFVGSSTSIFIPNIFSPDGDDVNDKLLIHAGSAIKEISALMIYDRWGNMVFDAQHFQPGDLSNTWDGKMNGKEMDPGVFAYMLIAELIGGGQITRYGDVTLVR